MSIDRRPTAIAYKATIGLISLPTALGLVPLPGSLSDGPSVYGIAAAVGIVGGCFISLFGLLWRGQRLTGLTLEQVGLVFICIGCLLYAGALFSVHIDDAVAAWQAGRGFLGFVVTLLQDISLALGMSLGIGIASGVQWVVIWRYRQDNVVCRG